MESLDVALMATSGFEERNPVVDRFNAQFAHLNGWVGRLGGLILAGKNCERNSAAIHSGHVLPQQGAEAPLSFEENKRDKILAGSAIRLK